MSRTSTPAGRASWAPGPRTTSPVRVSQRQQRHISQKKHLKNTQIWEEGVTSPSISHLDGLALGDKEFPWEQKPSQHLADHENL